MLSKDELEQIGKVIDARIDAKVAPLIKASEERTKKELKQAILDSQEDTISTLKEYIETAYNMHDKRIEKIEDTLDLPHPDKN